jgi:hypothetical protein
MDIVFKRKQWYKKKAVHVICFWSGLTAKLVLSISQEKGRNTSGISAGVLINGTVWFVTHIKHDLWKIQTRYARITNKCSEFIQKAKKIL